MLPLLGFSEQKLARDLELHEQARALAAVDPQTKRQQDLQVWAAWLGRYAERLVRESAPALEQRRGVMNGVNPRCAGQIQGLSLKLVFWFVLVKFV